MLSGDESSATLASSPIYLEMPSPTEGEQALPVFNAIWDVIKTWDVGVSAYYEGYCGANGSHVKLILDGLITIADDGLENSDDGLDVKEQERTGMYSLQSICRNCGKKDRVEIPVGRGVGLHPCPVCGCTTLERALFSEGYRVGSA